MASPNQNSEPPLPWLFRSRIGPAILLGLGIAVVLTCAGVMFVTLFPLVLLVLLMMGAGICLSVVMNYRRRLRGLGRRTIEHPLFGTLRFDEGHDAWCGQVELPGFAEYDMVAGKALFDSLAQEDAPDARPCHGDAEEEQLFRQGLFPLSVESLSGHEPSDAQQQAYRYLLANEGDIVRAVMERTFSVYDDCIDQWREDSWLESDEAEYLMPHLDSPDGFNKLMRLGGVAIHEREEDGVAEISFGFGCTWDEEHGWEVTTHKDRVVE